MTVIPFDREIIIICKFKIASWSASYIIIIFNVIGKMRKHVQYRRWAKRLVTMLISKQWAILPFLKCESTVVFRTVWKLTRNLLVRSVLMQTSHSRFTRRPLGVVKVRKGRKLYMQYDLMHGVCCTGMREMSRTLQKVKVPVVDRLRCGHIIDNTRANPWGITSNMLCAGELDKDSCKVMYTRP